MGPGGGRRVSGSMAQSYLMQMVQPQTPTEHGWEGPREGRDLSWRRVQLQAADGNPITGGTARLLPLPSTVMTVTEKHCWPQRPCIWGLNLSPGVNPVYLTSKHESCLTGISAHFLQTADKHFKEVIVGKPARVFLSSYSYLTWAPPV